MSEPDIVPPTMLLPTVAVYSDGDWVADGRDPDSDAPQVLSGLQVRWGRSTVVDQPQASTANLTLIDHTGGSRFLDMMRVGGRLDVVADARLTDAPDPDQGGKVVISESFETSTGNAYLTGGPAALSNPAGNATDGTRALAVATSGATQPTVFIPPGPRQPVNGDPTAWDDIPRSLPGDQWTLSVDVLLPPPFAGYSGWAAVVYPVSYDGPWAPGVLLLPVTGSETLPGGWTRRSGAFVPQPGKWLGAAVAFWPIGPAWDELDAVTTWDQLPGAPTLTNLVTNPAPAAVTGWSTNDSAKWTHTYANNEISVDRKASATANVAASWFNAGFGGAANPVLPAGTKYQRSVEIWVDAAATVVSSVAGGFVGGQALPAGQWTRVVEQFTGTGAAAYVLAADVSMPGVGTGVHCKLRRAQLIANPAGTTQTYFDGDTADTAAAQYDWTGAAGASTSTQTGLGVAATWDSLGAMLIDRVRLVAPASGTLRRGMVFSGRITDMEASYDEAAQATLVDVTAADQRAELGNRDVGDEPWGAEPLGTRFQRIVTASGQPIESRVSVTAAAYQVSWRDVDRQPAITLLSELATTADGVLWAATHPVTGPYLLLESLADRQALLMLDMGDDGLVHIVLRPVAATGALELDACDVLLDPVRWRHDIEDMATRVAVTWREQTVDDKGQPAPTDRTITVTNPPLEADIGVHRVAVGTQLAVQADASVIADAILGRTGNTEWRISGLEWRADTTDQLDADALTRMMRLLDGTSRNGIPIVLGNLPDWSPIPGRQVPLYLEGGSYESQDGAWRLSMIVSAATGTGMTAAWDELDPAWTWDQMAPDIRWVDLGGVMAP